MPQKPIFPALDWSEISGGHREVEALFDFLDDVQFWIKDVLGRYVRVNRCFLENYGFSDAAVVIGRTDHDLFPVPLAEQYRSDDLRVLKGAEIRNRIELVGRPDHSTGWHATDKLPLRSPQGRIIGTTGITRDIGAHSPRAMPFRDLEPVVERIRLRYAAPLAKPTLARLMGTSIRTLERRFSAAFGTSLIGYQRTLRMNQARYLLSASDDLITEIALVLGYADHSHFTREFTKMFGQPPRSYRRRCAELSSAQLPGTVRPLLPAK